MEEVEEIKTEGTMPEETIVEENVMIADEEPTTEEKEEVVAPEADTEVHSV